MPSYSNGLLALILSLMLLRCYNEVPTPEVLYDCAPEHLPGTHFPAYPNSYWTYRNAENQLVTLSISLPEEEFSGRCMVKFSNLSDSASTVYIDSTTFVAQAYNGLGQSNPFSSCIYSQHLDSVFVCPVAFSSMHVTSNFTTSDDIPSRRVTLNLDTSIVMYETAIYPHVIIMKEYFVSGPGLNTFHYLDYFADHIGLIKRDSINEISGDTTRLLTLDLYAIGH